MDSMTEERARLEIVLPRAARLGVPGAPFGGTLRETFSERPMREAIELEADKLPEAGMKTPDLTELLAGLPLAQAPYDSLADAQYGNLMECPEGEEAMVLAAIVKRALPRALEPGVREARIGVLIHRGQADVRLWIDNPTQPVMSADGLRIVYPGTPDRALRTSPQAVSAPAADGVTASPGTDSRTSEQSPS